MSVVESGAVDGIGLAENETMKMLITDHLDWQDEYKHLLILQEKINAYIGFCESGQYKEIYTDTSIKHIIFEIHFMFEPTQNTYRFLEQIPNRINELDLSIECHITEESENEDSLISRKNYTQPTP